MTTATTTQATWTKLNDGSWGVRVPGRATVGQRIEVSRRDGTRETKTVGAVLWTGTARDGRPASLVSIVASARRANAGDGHGRWTGCSCGSLEGVSRRSDCRSCRFENEDQ